jgi:hypothetical protein
MRWNKTDFSGSPGTSAYAPFVFLQRGVGAVCYVEPQASLALSGVGTVAFETFIGKDGPDMKVEADRLWQGVFPGIAVVEA